MKASSIVSRTLVAALVATGVAMTSPAWAANKPGQDLRICLKFLKPHCIRI